MKRIHITGGPGTGKTTLAAQLNRELGYEVFDQDAQSLAHIARLGAAFSHDQLAIDLILEATEKANEEAWISEGANLLVTRPFFERAEIIIVMYTSWRIASFRILTRHLKASLARNNRFPGLLDLYRFWRWSSHFYSNRNQAGLNIWGTPETLESMEAELRPYAAKLHRCYDKADIEALVRRLTTAPRSENPEAPCRLES